MRSRKPVRSLVALAALATVVWSCDESTDPRGPGSLSVSAQVQSQDNFFEYGISVDDGTPRRAFVGQTLFFTENGLAHGEHTVEVVDVPQPCTGTAPKTVTLRGDDTAAVIFNIACPRTTGDLRVTVTTTGSDIDEDGFQLTVEGVPGPTLPANGSITFTNVPPDVYLLGLSGAEPNCTLPADQNATVTAGQLTTVTFAVTCTPVGVLRFTTSVTGDDRDPDGMLVTIDGATRRLVVSGATNVRVPVGTRSYTLTDQQPNCTMTGPESGTHTLAAGDTVDVTTGLACTTIPAGTPGTTTLTEGAADTLPNQFNGPSSYDILGMNTRYSPGFMIVAIRFQKSVQSPATNLITALYGYLEFDIDESATTGKPAFANSFGGAASQGVDYFTDFFDTDTASVQLIRSPTASQPFFDGGRVRVRYDADSLVVFVPLNKLANDDGKMTVTMLLGTGDRPNDIAPNTGQAGVQPPAPLLAARAGNMTRITLDPTPKSPAPTSGTWRRNP
jgi:hypothetical protein